MHKKLTKIVATIGPSSESEEMIKTLLEKGVNVFRFNLKHNELSWHEDRIQRVKQVAESVDLPVGILIDLQGPEIRLRMSGDSVSCEEGESIAFGEEVLETQEAGFTLSHPEIISQLPNGQKILADDGAFQFTLKRDGEKVNLISHTTGILKNRKTINMPDAEFDFPVLVQRDLDALSLAKSGLVDFVALSFVREAHDIEVLRDEMTKQGITSSIIAKIETAKAIDHLEEIVETTDGIMIARGDLGIEMPAEEVPFYQKRMIELCIRSGKPVITATHMLQSMIENALPTRAEVSDVANAVYDFTDAVMLSGETAQGKYPVEAVEVMAKTARFTEEHRVLSPEKIYEMTAHNQREMMSEAALRLYKSLRKQGERVDGFLVFTQTGNTAKTLSRYRPKAPIYTFVPDETLVTRLTPHFGVFPILHKHNHQEEEIGREHIVDAISQLPKKESTGNRRFIVIHGDYWNIEGGTSTVKIVTV